MTSDRRKEDAMTMTTAIGVGLRELQAGDELPTITRVVSTRQLVQYAAVSRDFTPIHYDQDYARSANLDGVIIHGALKTSLFAQAVNEWIGGSGKLTALSASYRAVDYPGEPLAIHGKVTARDVDASTGELRLEIALELRNAAGDLTTPGKATVKLHEQISGE